MAFLKFNNSHIVGIAAGVPRVVEKTISTTSAYAAVDYMETTGVLEKRYSEEFTAADLSQAAANALMKDLNWTPKEIDALIFVSQTPDYILPATSCVLHGKMGLKRTCYTLDISLGCSGWVYGLSNILALMESGTIKKALLLCGDAKKCVHEEHDQLFGYAGTATALEYNPDKSKPIMFELGSDGTGYDAIIRPGGGSRHPFTEDSLTLKMCEDGRMRHDIQTRMKGMDVFAFGITTAPKSIKNLSKEFDIDYLESDYFVFHQANRKMNETIRKKLKIAPEKCPYSMTYFGNTSSASIPLTIVTQLPQASQGIKKFICCGFGVGLSWGSVAFETENLVIPNLVEL
ncbi:MAG: ketoacyl-ACP synthase III [Muribaculaceae bacterium]|nr:ketoacyl-ACP synthase III [Muribaculaceae bacterium]